MSSAPVYHLSDTHVVGHSRRLLERLSCFKCYCLMTDAVQLSCGDRLCKTCADETFSNLVYQSAGLEDRGVLNSSRCPNPKCAKYLELINGSKYIEDSDIQREVMDLLVHCPIFMCKCVVPLGKLQNHYKSHHPPYSATVEPSEPRNATHMIMSIDPSAVRMEDPSHLRRRLEDVKREEREVTLEQDQLRAEQDRIRREEDEVRAKEIELQYKKYEVRLRQNRVREREDDLKKKRQGMVVNEEDYANYLEECSYNMKMVRITTNNTQEQSLVPRARFDQEPELEYTSTVNSGRAGVAEATDLFVSGVLSLHTPSPQENEPPTLNTAAYQESTPPSSVHDRLAMPTNQHTRRQTDQSTSNSGRHPIYNGRAVAAANYPQSASNQMAPFAVLAYSQIERQGGYTNSTSQSPTAASNSGRAVYLHRGVYPSQHFQLVSEPTPSPMRMAATAPNFPTLYGATSQTEAVTVNGRANSAMNSRGVETDCQRCVVLKGVVSLLCETFATIKSSPRHFPRIMSPTMRRRKREDRHSC